MSRKQVAGILVFIFSLFGNGRVYANNMSWILTVNCAGARLRPLALVRNKREECESREGERKSENWAW